MERERSGKVSGRLEVSVREKRMVEPVGVGEMRPYATIAGTRSWAYRIAWHEQI